MPYMTNDDLPDPIKNHLPKRAQTIYRKAFNKAYHEYDSEVAVFKIAWAAVKKEYHKEGDHWVKNKK